MNLGTILFHKFFNGVAPEVVAQKYRNKAKESFTHFGMSGTGMFKVVAPHKPMNADDYQWKNVDLLVEFANANGLSIHYNTVITGHKDTMPEWYDSLDQVEKYQVLEDHVRTVIRRYKGKVEYFKLVNEAVREEKTNYL